MIKKPIPLMKTLHLIFLIAITHLIDAQENPILAFDNLSGDTWISEGKQLGGHDGKTVKEITWGLDGKIIKVKTYTTDPQSLAFGLRNEGIRIFNSQTNQMEFYEFDKLGGVSKGTVTIDGKNIYYEYSYGEMLLRDSWIFVSKDEYEYRVCSIVDSQCDKIFHQGVFKRKSK